MQQGVKCTEVWHVVFCWYSDLISHTHKHTYKDTQHTQGPVYWHTHIYIDLHHLLCAHSSYLYYTEWRFHWYQKFTFHNVFSFQKLFFWLDAMRLGSLCEIQIILIEMVQIKKHIHTPNTQKKIIIYFLIYQPLLFYGKSLNSPFFFFKNFENSTIQPPPFIKWGEGGGFQLWVFLGESFNKLGVRGLAYQESLNWEGKSIVEWMKH